MFIKLFFREKADSSKAKEMWVEYRHQVQRQKEGGWGSGKERMEVILNSSGFS